MAYVYLLLCGDGSYYAGWTSDLDKRIKQHAAGKGSRYTRAHLPIRLAYAERVADKPAALRREWTIKQCTHSEKHRLVEQWDGKY